jgi:hypothetical protein
MGAIAVIFLFIMLPLVGLSIVGMWWLVGFWPAVGFALFLWLLYRLARDDGGSRPDSRYPHGQNAFQRAAARHKDG